MKQPLRVLNLEDNPNDTELLQASLEDDGIECRMVRVETEKDFVSALAQGRFDLLLVDFKLPAFDGLSALAIAKEKCPDIPFIFVSGCIGDDIAIESLKRGATDYVLKDRLSRLAPAVRRALEEAEAKLEHKKALKMLTESESRYRNLVSSTLDGIYRTDETSSFIIINQAGAEILGHTSPEEVIGRHAVDYWYDAGDRDAMHSELKKKKSVRAYPIKGKNSRGEIIWLETSSHILEDEEGNFLGIEGILRDVTERRQAEEEKSRLEGQLRQSQKLEGLGQLAGGIAHDFNNILTAVIGFGSLLQMKLEHDSALRPLIKEILDAGNRGAAMTQQILAFSRKQVLDIKQVALNEVIKNIEKLLLRLIREDIKLRFVLSDTPLSVMADASQIDQVLINLATNARDAMPDGGELTISTRSFDIGNDKASLHGHRSTGRYALISVTDTGKGMDEQTKERIFEPFFTTKEVGKGTGLGLAVVYGIIKQHNGFVEVRSKPGQGTTIRIYLPRVMSGILESQEALREPVRDGTETILIAEDEESLRTLYSRILQQYGYTVIVSEDGVDAINKFRENQERVKLVILDVVMPRMSGREVRDEILKINPKVKTLFLSGYPGDVVLQKGVDEKECAFLSKPIQPEAFMRKIREMLDKK